MYNPQKIIIYFAAETLQTYYYYERLKSNIYYFVIIILIIIIIGDIRSVWTFLSQFHAKISSFFLGFYILFSYLSSVLGMLSIYK